MFKIKVKTIRQVLGICIIITSVILITSIISRNVQKDLEEIININEMIGKKSNKKFVKIQDSNGDIFYLPKGFKISDNPEEQIVQQGLVIIDNTGDKETNGSEFVWIPVKNINMSEFEEKFTNIYSQAYKTLDINYLRENKKTGEYINIKNSVLKYGGFYISRYEAGISSKMEKKLLEKEYLEKQFILQDTTNEFADGSYKPISKPNSIVWNYIQWGGTLEEKASDGFCGNDNTNGVVKVARSMYNKNTKTSVKSNLCYGNQWDAIMNFIDNGYYDGLCQEDSVILDSSKIGNYYNDLEKTGSDIMFSQKNIFDLSGNVWEWTMESFDDIYRVTRGGSYSSMGDIYSISASKEFYPNDNYKEIGFRIALWIQ